MRPAFILHGVQGVFSGFDKPEVKSACTVAFGDIAGPVLDDSRVVEFVMEQRNKRTVRLAGIGYQHVSRKLSPVDGIPGAKNIGEVTEDIVLIHVLDTLPEEQGIGGAGL